MKLLTTDPCIPKSKLIMDMINKGRRLAWYKPKVDVTYHIISISNPADYFGFPFIK